MVASRCGLLWAGLALIACLATGVQGECGRRPGPADLALQPIRPLAVARHAHRPTRLRATRAAYHRPLQLTPHCPPAAGGLTPVSSLAGLGPAALLLPLPPLAGASSAAAGLQGPAGAAEQPCQLDNAGCTARGALLRPLPAPPVHLMLPPDAAPPPPRAPALSLPTQCGHSRCMTCHADGKRCMECRPGRGFDYRGICKRVRCGGDAMPAGARRRCGWGAACGRTIAVLAELLQHVDGQATCAAHHSPLLSPVMTAAGSVLQPAGARGATCPLLSWPAPLTPRARAAAPPPPAAAVPGGGVQALRALHQLPGLQPGPSLPVPHLPRPEWPVPQGALL